MLVHFDSHIFARLTIQPALTAAPGASWVDIGFGFALRWSWLGYLLNMSNNFKTAKQHTFAHISFITLQIEARIVITVSNRLRPHVIVVDTQLVCERATVQIHTGGWSRLTSNHLRNR